MSETRHDFIPRTDAAFDRFFKGITQYVASKTSSSNNVWTHIIPDSKTALNTAYANWYNAYALTFNPHAPQGMNTVRETSSQE